MTKRRISLLASGAALMLAGGAAFAGGSFQTLPLVGGGSYCASTSTTSAGQTCTQTVPAGPATFTGNEVVPADLAAPGTNNGVPVNTALVDIQQLGQGAILDLTTVASTTIPAGTSWLFVHGTDASAYTITLPAAPVEGQIEHVVCAAATVGAMTVAANAGQSLLPAASPAAAACVAGNSYAWRYQASNTTWYRIQ